MKWRTRRSSPRKLPRSSGALLFEPDYAIHPGETLAETLEKLGMPQAELAQRLGRPLQMICEIIRGKKAIPAETALQLERATGVPADFWNPSQRTYEATLARIEEERGLARMALRQGLGFHGGEVHECLRYLLRWGISFIWRRGRLSKLVRLGTPLYCTLNRPLPKSGVSRSRASSGLVLKRMSWGMRQARRRSW